MEDPLCPRELEDETLRSSTNLVAIDIRKSKYIKRLQNHPKHDGNFLNHDVSRVR